MTNYNERLDEVFKTLNNKAREERTSCTERNNWEGYNTAYERLEHDAKQAITSLTKELVAEAKPGTWVDPEDTDDLEWQGYVRGVEHFEQNLLKGLEEK